MVLGMGKLTAADTGFFAFSFESSCSAGKPTAESNAETVAAMEWFGYEPSGQDVDLGGGLLVPGWVFVDPVQRAIGLADPYGYREHVTSTVRGVSWSGAKALFR